MSFTMKVFSRVALRSLVSNARVKASIPSSNAKVPTVCGALLRQEQRLVLGTIRDMSTDRKVCWKCGKPSLGSGSLFCPDCNALQKPELFGNYFELLGMEETFNINVPEMTKKFHKLQSVLHPDRFSNASEEEKEYSADISAYVNRAYSTLSDPLERGLYLLELQGSGISEENSSLDQVFLMEVMELNEELEALDTRDKILEFNARNKEALELITEEVSKALGSKDKDTAKQTLAKMKYYNTLRSKIKAKQQDLGIVE